MEEYDDLVPDPGEDGVCDMTSQGWKHLDDVVWKMGLQILTLNVSYNQIVELPEEVGDLILLKDLNIAYNDLKMLSYAALFAYGLATPIMYFMLLFFRRHKLLQPESQSEDEKEEDMLLGVLDTLYEGFQPKYFWWEARDIDCFSSWLDPSAAY